MNYRYTPFNTFSVIITAISIIFAFRMINDFSIYFLIPFLFATILWCIDYYFQRKKINFKKLFLTESIIVISIVLFYIRGIINAF